MWLHDYDETKAYGGAISSARTPEQTDLAEFIGGVGVSPLLQWHGTWRGIATDQELSVLDAARLFAMLSAASSDALIGCWDSKFQYAFWRPVTAIRAGGGNPDLIADPTWIGVVITPNHPEYPAAHGCFSGAVVEVLTTYFGSDELHFTMSSPAPGLLQPVRSYDRFSQALTDILNAPNLRWDALSQLDRLRLGIGEAGCAPGHRKFLPASQAVNEVSSKIVLAGAQQCDHAVPHEGV